MCGITGFYGNKTLNTSEFYSAHLLIKHRGPDDEGFSILENNKIIPSIGDDSIQGLKYKHITKFKPSNLILGHRRLSIIDLSKKGHQPMTDNTKRYTIIFNGEIYNYIELKAQLEKKGYNFKSYSDTEVLLNAYIEWGTSCFNKFNGMWAAAIYDNLDKKIILTRDRFGIKPLFYFKDERGLFFASEMKFILEFIKNKKVNIGRVKDYILDGRIDHTSDTLFKDIYQLEPGEYCIFDGENMNLQKYWFLKSDIKKKQKYNSVKNKLNNILDNSIAIRMRSDVPVGTLLSGGLDSTAIVCNLHDKIKIKTLKTYTSDFKDEKFSEKEYIKLTIEKTKFESNFIYPNKKEFLNNIEKLYFHHELPLTSYSTYAQWCLYERIKKDNQVKVLLNGQGSDEIFAGYTGDYFDYIAEKISKFQWIKALKTANYLKKNRNYKIIQTISNSLFKIIINKNIKIPKIFRNKLSKINHNSNMKLKFNNMLIQKQASNLTYSSLREFLRNEDRNSMAFSVESRLPFMDYRMVELAFNTPDEFKINYKNNKYILRDIAKEYCPKEIVNRKDKMGFVSPQDKLLRNELSDEINSILDKNKLFNSELNFLNNNIIKKEFGIFLKKNKSTFSGLFWRIYSYNKWKEIYFDEE